MRAASALSILSLSLLVAAAPLRVVDRTLNPVPRAVVAPDGGRRTGAGKRRLHSRDLLHQDDVVDVGFEKREEARLFDRRASQYGGGSVSSGEQGDGGGGGDGESPDGSGAEQARRSQGGSFADFGGFLKRRALFEASLRKRAAKERVREDAVMHQRRQYAAHLDARASAYGSAPSSADSGVDSSSSGADSSSTEGSASQSSGAEASPAAGSSDQTAASAPADGFIPLGDAGVGANVAAVQAGGLGSLASSVEQSLGGLLKGAGLKQRARDLSDAVRELERALDEAGAAPHPEKRALGDTVNAEVSNLGNTVGSAVDDLTGALGVGKRALGDTVDSEVSNAGNTLGNAVDDIMVAAGVGLKEKKSLGGTVDAEVATLGKTAGNVVDDLDDALGVGLKERDGEWEDEDLMQRDEFDS